ncbi:hypothetical protein DFH27DRAFT_17197 [Peziza echinospora]|nr:hypothetical protein DFH27DRAFT_17197 [Peziza echinospora]
MMQSRLAASRPRSCVRIEVFQGCHSARKHTPACAKLISVDDCPSRSSPPDAPQILRCPSQSQLHEWRYPGLRVGIVLHDWLAEKQSPRGQRIPKKNASTCQTRSRSTCRAAMQCTWSGVCKRHDNTLSTGRQRCEAARDWYEATNNRERTALEVSRPYPRAQLILHVLKKKNPHARAFFISIIWARDFSYPDLRRGSPFSFSMAVLGSSRSRTGMPSLVHFMAIGVLRSFPRKTSSPPVSKYTQSKLHYTAAIPNHPFHCTQTCTSSPALR